jgi:intron-binding protein aquarius
LTLVTGELWPSQRVLKDEEGADIPGELAEFQMENVEHLGQYVYEMTQAKVQQLRAEKGLPAAELVAPIGEGDMDFRAIPENDDEIREDIQEGFEAEEDE